MYLLTFDTGEFHTFRKPKDAVKWLSKQTCAVDIWATNLGYDLANLFQGSFQFLEITYVKGRRGNGSLTFDTGEFHTFRKPKDAVEWLSKQTCAVDIWATNLGYDLANLFQGSFSF